MGKWFEMTKHPLNTGCLEFQESLPRGLLYQIRKETKQLKQPGIFLEGFTKMWTSYPKATHFFFNGKVSIGWWMFPVPGMCPFNLGILTITIFRGGPKTRKSQAKHLFEWAEQVISTYGNDFGTAIQLRKLSRNLNQRGMFKGVPGSIKGDRKSRTSLIIPFGAVKRGQFGIFGNF